MLAAQHLSEMKSTRKIPRIFIFKSTRIRTCLVINNYPRMTLVLPRKPTHGCSNNASPRHFWGQSSNQLQALRDKLHLHHRPFLNSHLLLSPSPTPTTHSHIETIITHHEVLHHRPHFTFQRARRCKWRQLLQCWRPEAAW